MFTYPTSFFKGQQGQQGDPYWANLSLYLPMTGANGSTTFTDLSTYAHSITPSGDAQISTTQFPPLTGVDSSGLFDGSGDYLTCGAADLPEYDFGSGDFVIRSFVRINTSVSSLTTIVFLGAGSAGSTQSFAVEILSNNAGFRFFSYQGGSISTISYRGGIAANTWYYIGVVRTSGTIGLWLNGSEVETVSNAQTFNTEPGRILRVGSFLGTTRYFPGNISHIQIYKGVSFPLDVVPTEPFPVG